MNSVTVAAVDIGAESGRVAAARFDGTRIELRIHHRFPHQPTLRAGWLHWDTDSLWREISHGLASLARSEEIASVGVDTWGVDYGLYDARGILLDDPVAYRDEHRIAVADRIIRTLGAERMYEATGTQLIEINTLFGLVADADQRPELFARAEKMLMMPDVFHRMLSGSDVTETTAASTSGMYDMTNREWARPLIEDAKVPVKLLPNIAEPGTIVGPVIGELATAGLGHTQVVLPPAHDTASAVLAIPGAASDTLFISSGTWSLVGVVLEAPIINAEAAHANLSNEAGYGDSVLFQRNVMGLWVMQECRRQWQREGRGIHVDYDALVALATSETELRTIVNLNATEFVAPGDMPERIVDQVRRHAIPVPETIGQLVRTIIDSLALSYRLAAEDIARLTGVPIRQVAVVGGGARNALLQQATADATGLSVVCWAEEATALGNSASQLRALGEVGSIEHIWDVIRASTTCRTYQPRTRQPRTGARWARAAATLRDLEREESRRRGLEDPVLHQTNPHQQLGRHESDK